MNNSLVQHSGYSIADLTRILSMFLYTATLKSNLILQSQLNPVFQVFRLLFYMYLSLFNAFHLIYRAYLRTFSHHDNILRRLRRTALLQILFTLSALVLNVSSVLRSQMLQLI
jgi:hypothetical protein